jgi:hypothetical protein
MFPHVGRYATLLGTQLVLWSALLALSLFLYYLWLEDVKSIAQLRLAQTLFYLAYFTPVFLASLVTYRHSSSKHRQRDALLAIVISFVVVGFVSLFLLFFLSAHNDCKTGNEYPFRVPCNFGIE